MVDFNVSGNNRKRLVKCLEKLTGQRAVYCGMPTMAFKVGEYTVSKSGEVTGGELSEEWLDALSRSGFHPVSQAEDEEPTGIVISVSLDDISDSTIVNFENMVSSKGELIKKAFNLQELPIKKTEDELQILWFADKQPDDQAVAEAFVEAMLNKAKQQRYVNPEPLETDNERYSFRVFANSLGFTGPEHKHLRTELLKNLTGSSAWRHGKPRQPMKLNTENE